MGIEKRIDWRKGIRQGFVNAGYLSLGAIVFALTMKNCANVNSFSSAEFKIDKVRIHADTQTQKMFREYDINKDGVIDSAECWKVNYTKDSLYWFER